MKLLQLALSIGALSSAWGCGGFPAFSTCAAVCQPMAKIKVMDEAGSPIVVMSGTITIGNETTTVSCPNQSNCVDGVIEASADFERTPSAEVHLESSGRKFDGVVSLSAYRDTGEYRCSSPCREANATVTLR